MIHQVFANRSNAGDWLSARGIPALGLARWRGEMHCWPEGEYAEVFAAMKFAARRPAARGAP